jgi:hypothetical protein
MPKVKVKPYIPPSWKNKAINKKYSLQFLPEEMSDLSKIKKLSFDGKNLKSEYLIDIIHHLILRYYFKKENIFPLYSPILKEKYGYLYNYYIKYLVNRGYLVLSKNYLKGSNSRLYSLSKNILSGKINRYRNYDKFLLKKYNDKHLISEFENSKLIENDVKVKLIEDLEKVTIQYDKAIFYLDALSNKEGEIYERNLYSVESIKENHIFYHFDVYGRFHTNFTILKSFIRKNCLLIDSEETCEIDIPNSQPFFLAKIMNDSKSHWIKNDELELFTYLVRNGLYYQYLVDNLNLKDKSEAKDLTYKVLFGKNYSTCTADKKFIKLFPSIHTYIKLYKKEHGNYRILSHHLQKLESQLVFNGIGKTLMNLYPDLSWITVHDSLIIGKSNRDKVKVIFDQYLEELWKLEINI